MQDLIERQKILDWLNQFAQSIFIRGPMYGSFAEQEATLVTLLSVRDFILGLSPRNSLDNSRNEICKKYQLKTIFSFSDQFQDKQPSIKEQEQFSQILKDWWEYE